jgi:hypothetical protein
MNVFENESILQAARRHAGATPTVRAAAALHVALIHAKLRGIDAETLEQIAQAFGVALPGRP